MSRKQSKIITLLILYVLLTIGTFIQTVLPALMPTLSDLYPVEMSEGRIGYIVGTMIITMATAGVIMGYLGDKIRRMKVAFVASIITTTFTFLSGFISNYTELFLCQIGTSIGLGAILPIMAGILADLYAPEQRGRAFGLLSIMTTVLGEVGGIVLTLLIAQVNWRWTYYLLGTISAIITPLLYFAKEPKRGSKEKSLEIVYEEDPTLEYSYKIKFKDLKYLWKRPTNLYLILNFVDNIPGAVFSTYAIAWLQIEHGADDGTAMLGLIIVVLGIFIGTVVFGTFGDKKFKTDKRIKVKLGTILSMASAPFILLAINLSWKLEPGQSLFDNTIGLISILLLSMGLLIDGGIYPNFLSAITDVNLPEHRSTMISLANFFDACGRSIGAFLGGYLIIHFGYPKAMTFASLFTILSFVWWVPSLKTFIKDYETVQNILIEHAETLRNN